MRHRIRQPSRVLRVDCSAGFVAGVAVLLLSAWLSRLYALPRGALVAMGVANLAYATFSFSLARRAPVPRDLLLTLVAANALWATLCVAAALRLAGSASAFGLAHLVGEGLFVGALAAWEWAQRDRLAPRAPADVEARIVAASARASRPLSRDGMSPDEEIPGPG